MFPGRSPRCHHRLAGTCVIAGMVCAWLTLGSGKLAVGAEGSARSGERRFWAFQPLLPAAVPQVQQAGRARTPIDAFVLARLEASGLTFSADAERSTLLRRAYLDLIGLPPSPAEVDAFLADSRPDAYERLLDRLLASPHFGERWGRHWLDVAGYADTIGFDGNPNHILLSEGKWRYRDWVIQAFNADKPYNRFVSEQLAGDELVDWRKAAWFTPEVRDCLIATGFLRTARDQTHEPESNIPLNHYGVLHDTLEIVGNSLLGLTLQCARCHNHKFDPIPQEDYYRLMAVFTPAYNPRAWKPVYPWKPEIPDRALPDVSAEERTKTERHNREIDRQVAELNQGLARLRQAYEQRLFEAKLQGLPEPIRADTRAALGTPVDKRTQVQKYLADKFEVLLKVKPEEVAAALSPADKAAMDKLGTQVAALTRQRRTWGKIQALWDVGPPPSTHLLRRGNHETPDREVSPGFLRALSEAHTPNFFTLQQPAAANSGRRLALAHWLTSPEAPASALLVRVMVNRLWQHLLGQGLVPTPGNFGVQGERPTHPELLEWLSSEFVRNGWRVKPLLKLMMTSTIYRQASASPQVATGGLEPDKIDPENRLLWRMRLRRLESEIIRDSLLVVSGQLDRAMGGPPILLQTAPDGKVDIDESKLARPSDGRRRSVYLLTRRAYHHSLLTVFDQPGIATSCARRDASAVPLQALAMLNDRLVLDAAGHFAARIRQVAPAEADWVPTAFRLALVRRPTDAETAACLELLRQQKELYQGLKFAPAEAAQRALVELCHTVLNTSEFLYAE